MIRVTALLSALLLCLHAHGTDDPTNSGHRGKITIGKDTTYITEPLDAKGYVDYVAALNERLAQGVTPENNANVLLWKAFGPHPLRSKISPEVFKALGIEAPPEKGDYYVDSFEFLQTDLKADLRTDKGQEVRQTFDDSLAMAIQRPWTEKEYPNLERWLKINEKPLAVVAEAMKRDHFYNPLIPVSAGQRIPGLRSVALPAVQECRLIAHTLTARAFLRAGEGNTSAAWQDLLTCHLLARSVARGGEPLEGSVGNGMDNAAFRADLAFLESTKPTAAQIEGYLSDLRKLPPMSDLASKIDLYQRYFALESVRLADEQGLPYLKSLVAGTGDTIGLEVLSELAFFGVDWDPVLSDINHRIDRVVMIMNEKDRTTRAKNLKEFTVEIKALKTKFSNAWTLSTIPLASAEQKGKFLGDMLVYLNFQYVEGLQNAWDKHQQSQINLELAFALGAFHADQGNYPKDLSELAPKYLKEIPKDLFSDKPMIYRPSDKGYQLYSVGPNGKDEDGGRDDIAVVMPSPTPKKP